MAEIYLQSVTLLTCLKLKYILMGNNNSYNGLTIIFGCSFKGLPLCSHDKFGNGLPFKVHSSFSFCPARAITLLKHDEKDGGSVFESLPATAIPNE